MTCWLRLATQTPVSNGTRHRLPPRGGGAAFVARALFPADGRVGQQQAGWLAGWVGAARQTEAEGAAGGGAEAGGPSAAAAPSRDSSDGAGSDTPLASAAVLKLATCPARSTPPPRLLPRPRPDLVVIHDALRFGSCHLALGVPMSGRFAGVETLEQLRSMPWTEQQPLR